MPTITIEATRRHSNGLAVPLNHPYVEDCLTHRYGPTAVMLLRMAWRRWLADPVWHTSVDQLAGLLGVGGGEGRHAVVPKTLHRLHQFHVLTPTVQGHWLCFDTVPVLSGRLLERAPHPVRAAHEVYVATLSTVAA
jgi:hypothetical protein